MQNNEIIDLYFARNEKAIKISRQKFGSYCHCVANNILHNDQDSEECVNETCLRAWNSIPPQRPRKLNFFFAKITRNLSFDKYRKNTTLKRGANEMPLVLDELDNCISSRDTVQSQVDNELLAKLINSFIENLPKREREIFLLRYFYVLSIDEISAELELSTANIYKILSRTRIKLKEKLESEEVYV